MGTRNKDRFEVLLHGEQSLKASEGKTSTGKTRQPENSWMYLQYFGQIGFAITVPIVIGALIGSSLDARFGSRPKMTLIGLFGGIIISWIGFFQMIRDLLKKRKNL